MKSSEFKRFLKKNGCKFYRQGKGSHEMWISEINNCIFPVPAHGEIPTGTVEAIKKQAGIK